MAPDDLKTYLGTAKGGGWLAWPIGRRDGEAERHGGRIRRKKRNFRKVMTHGGQDDRRTTTRARW